ncbi:PIN domain-containing protein [Ectothiorhodospira marina]|uniref:PIN domain-containing protein n=1 Tax=Ectothiorhodospira marina TaxID=1396821 RepID=A0A1H7M2I1_9GAMM|nr:PIN domain-containing protein [Ectothiorhodospira marina]SEL05361.1 hypothetical protein SAMN05444515_108113 [Ectothiorhodospira marina]
MIMLDLNVLLDVLQKREPHYRVSAAVLEKLLRGDEVGALSAHAATTVYYLVARYADRAAADRAMSWLLKHLHVCACIVTRNVKDFTASPVPALTPQEYLLR